MNFKSKKAYQKWNAYGHMHTKTGLKVSAKAGRKSVFAATPGNQKISIRGKSHKVIRNPVKWNTKGQMGLMVGLLLGFMVVAMLVTLLPGFVTLIDSSRNSQGLNCPGYIEHSGVGGVVGGVNLTYQADVGSKSTIACLAMTLYLPYLVLAILIGIVIKLLMPSQQPAQYGGY